jgi:allantoate deiminase
MTNSDLALTVLQRIAELAKFSDEPGRLTRTFCSPAMRKAHDLVGLWMRESGMSVSEDAIGNLVGRYPGRAEHSKTFILGSHLDTVRGAGKFDGALGVLVAIACVQHLYDQKSLLPFSIEVVGFGDSQGLRYGTHHLGSSVMAGTFDEADLQKVDANGISMAEALRAFGCRPENLENARRDPQRLLGYAEVHIEQGPILESNLQPIGVVSAISGHARVHVRFTGEAAHAGATPMATRRDALVAAAQFIQAVETCTRLYNGLVATVGQIETRPGHPEVVPSEVLLTVDVCHPAENIRTAALGRLLESANHAGQARGIGVEWQVVNETESVTCSRELNKLLSKAARQHIVDVTELPSGARHDAAALGNITPATMLFVRCRGGVTHHRDEAVALEDIELAVATMNDFLHGLANLQNPFAGKTEYLKRAFSNVNTSSLTLAPAISHSRTVVTPEGKRDAAPDFNDAVPA